MKKTRLLTSLFALALLASCGGEATTNTATNPGTTTADTTTTDTGASDTTPTNTGDTTPDTTTGDTTPEETTPESTPEPEPSDQLTKEMFAQLKAGVAFEGVVSTYYEDYEFGWLEQYSIQANNVGLSFAWGDVEEDEETGDPIFPETLNHTGYYREATPFEDEDGLQEGKTALVSLGLDNELSEQHPFSFDTYEYFDYAETGFASLFDGFKASDFEADEEFFEDDLDAETFYAFTWVMDPEEEDEEVIAYYDDLTSKIANVLYASIGNYPLDRITLITDGFNIVGLDAYSFTEDEFYGAFSQTFMYDVVALGDDVQVKEVKKVEGETIPELEAALATLRNNVYNAEAMWLEYDEDLEDYYPYSMAEEFALGNNVFSLIYNEDGIEDGFGFTLMEYNETLYQQNYTFIGESFYYDDLPTTKVTDEFTSFGISSVFFTPVEDEEGTYLFDYEAALATIPGLDNEFTSLAFSYSYEWEFTQLSITVDEGEVFVEFYDANYNDYLDIYYYNIGDPEYDAEMFAFDGDDLTWDDLLSGSTNYEQALTNVGGKDVLDLVPVLGGYYNTAGLYADAKGTTQIQYKLGSGSLSVAAIDSAVVSYQAKLEEAGYTITDGYDSTNPDDPWQVIGNLDVEIEGTSYNLQVAFFVAQDSQKNYYFIINPVISANSVE